MSKVCLFKNDVNFRFKNVRLVKDAILALFKTEKVELETINYIFCTDEYLLEINKKFLDHDYFTDIISFNLGDNKSVIGEVYISIERVKENALNLKETFSRELLRVLFHGALHFCGYKDKTKNEQVQMRSKENFYLQLFYAGK
jgi:probable rRNA maturation factor